MDYIKKLKKNFSQLNWKSLDFLFNLCPGGCVCFARAKIKFYPIVIITHLLSSCQVLFFMYTVCTIFFQGENLTPVSNFHICQTAAAVKFLGSCDFKELQILKRATKFSIIIIESRKEINNISSPMYKKWSEKI